MKAPVVLLFACLLLLTSFGCVQQHVYPSVQSENVVNYESTDMDQDKKMDYAVYNYGAYSPPDSGLTLRRQVTVSSESKAEYTDFAELTDLGLLVTDSKLEDMAKKKTLEGDACAASVGVLHFTCIDASTCAKLCSKASLKCKNIAANHETVLGDNIMSFVKDSDQIDATINDARRLVLKLKSATPEDKDAFLNKLRSVISKAAAINANPLYNNPQIGLCTHSTLGVEDLENISLYLGNFTTETER